MNITQIEKLVSGESAELNLVAITVQLLSEESRTRLLESAVSKSLADVKVHHGEDKKTFVNRLFHKMQSLMPADTAHAFSLAVYERFEIDARHSVGRRGPKRTFEDFAQAWEETQRTRRLR